MEIKIDTDVAFDNSIKLLEQASTGNGILASLEDKDNYKRIWTRDGIVSGLAGLLAGNQKIIESLKQTLTLLAKCQGPEGQIPSNVKVNGDKKVDEISYGRLVGRVDTIPWFVIGVCNYAALTNDINFAYRLKDNLQKSLSLLIAWEYNHNGLVYVPQSGDWTDEQIFHGYILYDQLLRIWALRNYASLFNDVVERRRAEKITELVQTNYWITQKDKGSQLIIHKSAYEKYLNKFGDSKFGMITLTPGGYPVYFDSLANALAIILTIPTEDSISESINYAEDIIKQNPFGLLPNIFPPIREISYEYELLKTNYTVEFRNNPFEYQNGGTWPIINGWWGVALVSENRTEQAYTILNLINTFNMFKKKSSFSFYEFGNSKTGNVGGTSRFSWSAAASVLLKSYIDGKSFFIE